MVIQRNITIGPLYHHEIIAKKTGNLLAEKKEIINHQERNHDHTNISIIDFIFPIGLLLVSIVSCLLVGIDAMQSLFIATAFTIITCIPFFILRKKLQSKDILGLCKEGIMLMTPSIIVLLLAFTLSDLSNTNLKVGEYLSSIIIGKVSIQFLPIMFFIATTIIATAMCSAWGTMAIMIPLSVHLLLSFLHISTPTLPSALPILFPVLGAVLSGSVAGNLLALTSDLNIMSSTSAGAYQLDFFKVQLPYLTIAIFSACAAYLVSGFLIDFSPIWNVSISLFTGLLLSCTTLYLLNKTKK